MTMAGTFGLLTMPTQAQQQATTLIHDQAKTTESSQTPQTKSSGKLVF